MWTVWVMMDYEGLIVGVFKNQTMKILTFVFQKKVLPRRLHTLKFHAITHKHNYGSLIHFLFILFQKIHLTLPYFVNNTF